MNPILVILPIIGFIIGLAISVFYISCFWKLFTKAGKPGWFCLIPGFNMIMFYIITKTIIFLPIILVAEIIFAIVSNIVGDVFVILSIILLVAIVICGIICWFKIFKAYGKGIGFAILSLFFGFITIPIMAYGKSEYIYSDNTNNLSDDDIDFEEGDSVSQPAQPQNKQPIKPQPIQQPIAQSTNEMDFEDSSDIAADDAQDNNENFFMNNDTEDDIDLMSNEDNSPKIENNSLSMDDNETTANFTDDDMEFSFDEEDNKEEE